MVPYRRSSLASDVEGFPRTILLEAIKAGVQIGTIWPFNPQYDRSPVYITVYMTEEMKALLEERTKYRFRDPPVLKLA